MSEKRDKANRSQIDLDDLIAGYSLTLVTSETEAERVARIDRQNAEAKHDRRKDSVLFGVSIIAVGTILIFSLWSAAQQKPFPSHSPWITLIGSIASGFVGYLVGKSKGNR